MSWKPSYASVPEMREWLAINNVANTDHDNLLRRKLAAASRAVDGSCGRQFGKVETAVTRSFDMRWSRTWCVYVAEITDIMDLTGLVVSVNGTTLTADQYSLRDRNAPADGKPYTYVMLTGGVSSTTYPLDMLGLWGWSPTWPEAVTEATLLQASRLNIRTGSPYGIAGGSDSGSQLRLLDRLDPDVAPIVHDYVHPGWVAK